MTFWSLGLKTHASPPFPASNPTEIVGYPPVDVTAFSAGLTVGFAAQCLPTTY